MLPCQAQCSQYCPGCHKQCPHWRQYLDRQKEVRAAKRAYLRYYTDLCGTVTRQLRACAARYPAW